MGIIKRYTENNCQIAIWDLNESLTELLKLGARFDSSNFKTEKRKKDFLVSRLLLNELEPNQQISYISPAKVVLLPLSETFPGQYDDIRCVLVEYCEFPSAISGHVN